LFLSLIRKKKKKTETKLYTKRGFVLFVGFGYFFRIDINVKILGKKNMARSNCSIG